MKVILWLSLSLAVFAQVDDTQQLKELLKIRRLYVERLAGGEREVGILQSVHGALPGRQIFLLGDDLAVGLIGRAVEQAIGQHAEEHGDVHRGGVAHHLDVGAGVQHPGEALHLQLGESDDRFRAAEGGAVGDAGAAFEQLGAAARCGDDAQLQLSSRLWTGASPAPGDRFREKWKRLQNCA